VRTLLPMYVFIDKLPKSWNDYKFKLKHEKK